MSDREGLRQPQFIDEAEAMLGCAFFYDEQRSTALYENVNELGSEEFGARREAYLGMLRVLAEARRQERSEQGEISDIKEWNRCWGQQLTSQKLGKIVASQYETIYPHSRKLAILNHAERTFEEGFAAEGLFEHQVPYLQQVISALQRGSERVHLPSWWPENDEVYYTHGVTVTGPTGIGKTAIMARLAKALGAGRPPEVVHPEWFGENYPVRILGISPTQSAIARLLGDGGNDLFGQLCPEVEVGGMYSYEHIPDADVVFSSKQLFITHFADSKLAGRPVDAIFVDEVHHLTEPILLQSFLKNWFGTTIGFSATPAYSAAKDARHILRHEIKVKDTLEYIGNELSDIEAYTILIHPNDFGLTGKDIEAMDAAELRQTRRNKVNEIARDFVVPLVSEGRKGMIFCEPGARSEHAKDLAALLDGLPLPGGRRLKARALGNFQGTSHSAANRSLLSQYDAGQIDILTTTSMGEEALHLNEVNFVVAACKISSALRTFQIGGRGLARSERFDTCVFANINTLGFGQHPWFTKTFEGVYTGSDGITQGGIMPQKRPDSRGNNPKKHTPRKRSQAERIHFSDYVQKLLDRVDDKTLAEGFLGSRGQEVPVTPGYIRLEDIIRDAGISRSSAMHQLDRAGYRREIRTQVRENRIKPVRYYEPLAMTYFTDDPLPPKDGVPLKQLQKFAKRTEIITLRDMEAALSLGNRYLFNNYLTAEEKQEAERLRTVGENMPLTWPRARGEEIIERIRKLLVMPAHLALAGVVAARLRARPRTVAVFISRGREALEVEMLFRGKQSFPALPWSSVKQLAERYGAEDETLFEFDLAALPANKDDKDPQKILYARRLQRQLGTSPDWLPPEVTNP